MMKLPAHVQNVASRAVVAIFRRHGFNAAEIVRRYTPLEANGRDAASFTDIARAFDVPLAVFLDELAAEMT